MSRRLGLAFVALAVFALGVWVGGRYLAPGGLPAPEEELPSERPDEERPGPPPGPSTVPSEEVVPTPAPSVPRLGARIALVIDDLGRSVAVLDRLESLGVPLSYAVLPFESRSREVASEISRRGRELLCHLPMEPESGANPGPGALSSEMDREALQAATRAALANVPGAVGVNNHMGSGLTKDPAAMRAILEVVDERGLFFVDSRTSAESVGYRLALEEGIPAAERQVFLDGDPDSEEIAYQFDRLLGMARDEGAAIAIGHPHAVTLEVLAREIPAAVAAGYEFVPVSYLLDRAVAPE